MQPREHFIAGYLLPLSTRACAGYMLLFAIPMSVFLFLLIFFSGHRELTHGFWRILLLAAALALACLAVLGLERFAPGYIAAFHTIYV